MKSDLCKECGVEPRISRLKAKCAKCVNRRAKAKEMANKSKAKERAAIRKEKKKAEPSQGKADALFQMYVRRRDFGDEGGRCFICGEWTPYKGSQPMHFVSRNCSQLRWEEDNCWAGCSICNVYKKGNYPAYTLVMQEKFGREKVAQMVATKWQTDGRPAKIRQKEAIEKYTRLLTEMGRNANWKSKEFGEKVKT